jgi:ABC-2 type transport system ATP-binding protein
MMDLATETYGLTKRFGSVQALESLNLHVPRGSIFGFLGPNRAGKSTTITLVLGLSRATAGNGQIFELDVQAEPGDSTQDWVPGPGTSVHDDLTLRETLLFVARFFASRPPEALERRIAESIELVGLQDKGRPCHLRLQQRRAPATRHCAGAGPSAQLPILGEPAASLDPMGRHDVLEIMQRVRERGTTRVPQHPHSQ